jgi:hypothetical protein
MWSLVYLVARTLVRLLVIGGQRDRDDVVRDLEILVLRHQLQVLSRTSGPPRLRRLDHVLIYGRRHLERVLQTYVAHYLHERPHRGLRLAVPAGTRAPQARRTTQTPVERKDVLGGLIHEYCRAA